MIHNYSSAIGRVKCGHNCEHKRYRISVHSSYTCTTLVEVHELHVQ